MKTKLKLLLLASFFSFYISATPWDGISKTAWNNVAGVNDGTAVDKPFLIDSPEQLAKLAELVNAGNTYSGVFFKLTTDIDLANQSWTCIGDLNPFSGNFDGNWHTISNLSITKWTQNIGLFGLINSAIIKNLGIESGNITCGGSNAGALVGQATGSVSNLSVISNCYNKANVVKGASDPRTYIGGIAGLLLSYTTIDHCYNRGNVTNDGNASSTQTGGIAGAVATGSTIFSCYSTGIIIGNNVKGGIVGSNWSATTYAYYDSDVCVGINAATQAMGNTANTANATGMTTANMKLASFTTTLNGAGTYWTSSTGNYPPLAGEIVPAWDGSSKTAWNNVSGVNDGTSSDKPFLIETPEQLAKLAELVNAGNSYSGQYFKLTKDLNLGNKSWTCIGDVNAFSGNFNGNWHTISNLSITKWTQNIGLFGRINSATIKNLGIESGIVTCGGNNAGALVGQATGTISSLSMISNCYNKAAIVKGASDPRTYIGGIAGLLLNYTTIDHCYNKGNVTNDGNASSNQTGGIAGAVATGSTIFSCYSTGIIIGNNVKGGIVGSNWSATTYAYYDSDVCVGINAATQAMGNTANTANVTGMTTVNMKAASLVTTLNGAGSSWTTSAIDYPSFNTANVVLATNNNTTGTVWGSGKFIKGVAITVTAVPNSGYRFVSWSENNTDVSSNSVYVFTPTSNRTLQANFASNTVSIGSAINVSVTSLNNCENCNVTLNDGAQLTVDANKTLNSMTIRPGAKLTLNSGQTLTATNGITLQSDATGTATILNSGTYTGTITAEQYLGSARNWYVSSPVTNATSPATNITRYYEYVEAGDNADFSVTGSTAYWKGLNTGSSMTVGKGYIAQASAGTTVQFSGTPNNGNITTSFNLTRDDAKGKGFNLVGNPYPSYIDWSLVAQANTNLMSTAWFKTKKTDLAGGGYTFASVNVITPSSPEIVSNNANTTITKYIPPTQAFWVRVKGGTSSTSMSFTNAMREHRLNGGDLMKAPKLIERSRLRLQLINGIESDETLIYFDKVATNNFNEYDSPKMMNNSSVTPDLYTKAGVERLVINGLNAISDNMELPLGFSLNAAGSLKLKATEMSNFSVGTRIYLLDKVENTQTELIPQTEYSFSTTTATTNNESRFSLIFRASGVTTEIDNAEKLNTQVFVNATNQIAIIAREKSNYVIYNAVGQKVNEGITTSNRTIVNEINDSGIFVVQVNNDLTKVIIK